MEDGGFVAKLPEGKDGGGDDGARAAGDEGGDGGDGLEVSSSGGGSRRVERVESGQGVFESRTRIPGTRISPRLYLVCCGRPESEGDGGLTLQ